MPLALLATGADERWHPGIGDPTFVGWLTVVAYGLSAALCFRALTASRLRLASGGESSHPRSDALALVWFWLGLFVAMLLLGVNKQLDLQTLLTQVARDMSKSQGWYHDRRGVQKLFIVAVAVLGGGMSLGLAYAMRRVLREVWLAVLGISELALFVVIRAASFHHVDTLLFFGPLRLNWILELTGIVLTGWGAWSYARGLARLSQRAQAT